MARVVAPYIVGPVCWLIGYGAMLMLTTLWWELRMDTYLTNGLVTYISSAISTYAAYLIMSRINPEISALRCFVIIAIFSLLWIGSAIVSSVYLGSYVYKYQIVSLIAAQIGSFSSMSNGLRNGC
ncbi:MAG: hypothetical protein V7707_15625 [Motiliproteus sp.]